MTYEALRRVDCQENQLDTYCERTFANDYIEYERQRRDFIRDTTDSPWRVGTTTGQDLVDTRLEGVSR